MIRVKRAHPAGETQCRDCGETLLFDESDVRYGPHGVALIECPLCHRKVLAGDAYDKKLTSKTIEYPAHFRIYANGLDIPDEQIRRYARETLEELESDPTTQWASRFAGNTYVIATRSKDEIEVVVAKNYEICSIITEENNA